MRWIRIIWPLVPGLLFGSTATEIADSYVQEALRHNPGLRAERRQMDLSRADRRSAFGQFLPVVDLSSRHSWADGGRDIVFDVNDFLPPEILPADLPPQVIPFLRSKEQETKIQAVQPLFAGGGILYSYRAARERESAAGSTLESSCAELALQVRRAYYHYLQARELAAVSREQLESVREQLRATRAMFETDKLPVSELRRAEAAEKSAEARKISADESANRAAQGLNLLLGRELECEIRLPATVAEPEITGIEPEIAVQSARESRPELKALHHSLSALREQQRATRSRYLPSVSAAFEYGFQGEKYDFGDEYDYYLLSGVLSWNLFEGFRSNVARQKVAISRRQLEDRRDWLEDTVEQQVSTALLRLQSTHAEYTAAKAAHDAARESFRLTELRYREGSATQLELIDARSMLALAASQEIIARYGHLVARAELDRSMGTIPEEIEP